MRKRPTGIIRTLPYYGAGDTREDQAKRRAFQRMIRSFRRMEIDSEATVRIAFSQLPTIDVLHCYILVDGKIHVRANIASFEKGMGEHVPSWDGTDLSGAKYWAILTAPVSWPGEPILRRGFQGFRYTEDLW